MTDGLSGAALIAVVALVPLVALMLTSFVKVSIVLALLRNAIGSPDAPSGLVVMGISLVLTFFVMAPVAIDMVRAAAPTVPGPGGAKVPAPGPSGGAPGSPTAPPTAPTGGSVAPESPRVGSAAPSSVAPAGATPSAGPSGAVPPTGATGSAAAVGSTAPTGSSAAPAGAAGAGAAPTSGADPAPPAGLVPLDLEGTLRALVPDEHASKVDAGTRALRPLRDFLVRHAGPSDRETFVNLAESMGRSVTGDELWILAPAFLTTELREAFAIAVLLFIPFLVLDLVVALGLAALGLASTQPGPIALPLKLLLFVAVDGWRLLVESLLRGYL